MTTKLAGFRLSVASETLHEAQIVTRSGILFLVARGLLSGRLEWVVTVQFAASAIYALPLPLLTQSVEP